ncbi:hypothetical protein KSP40_PGU013739 [Platanthera guangdongensis]|uniref:Uncharacterized protein n=1 Tax=Platanthera guangdongensis TaxID=2320717 RepID=A0ABR2MTJ1_9ASPA
MRPGDVAVSGCGPWGRICATEAATGWLAGCRRSKGRQSPLPQAINNNPVLLKPQKLLLCHFLLLQSEVGLGKEVAAEMLHKALPPVPGHKAVNVTTRKLIQRALE